MTASFVGTVVWIEYKPGVSNLGRNTVYSNGIQEL